MASKLNKLQCFSGGGNVGRPECDIIPGLEIGAIIVPRGYKFDPADLVDDESFLAALEAAAVADDPRQRIFVIGTFYTPSASGEAAQTETIGPVTRRLRNATIQHDFVMLDGKIYHSNLVQALDDKAGQYDYLKITEQTGGMFAVWGAREQDDTSGDDTMGGYRLRTLYVSDDSDAIDGTGYRFTVTRGFADSNQVNVNFAVMEIGFNPISEVDGLQTVKLKATSTTATTIQVKATTGNGSQDIHDIYDTELSAATAWIVKNADSTSPNMGNAITVASVANNATGWTLTIAATGVDPDNPGSGKRVSVQMAAPSVLGAAPINVDGLESNIAYVTLG